MKEDFHGFAEPRVSVVKPNIRDSIPNTEPTMRVCRPKGRREGEKRGKE